MVYRSFTEEIKLIAETRQLLYKFRNSEIADTFIWFLTVSPKMKILCNHQRS